MQVAPRSQNGMLRAVSVRLHARPLLGRLFVFIKITIKYAIFLMPSGIFFSLRCIPCGLKVKQENSKKEKAELCALPDLLLLFFLFFLARRVQVVVHTHEV